MAFLDDIETTYPELEHTGNSATAYLMRTPEQRRTLQVVASTFLRTYPGLTPVERQERINGMLFGRFAERYMHELGSSPDRDAYLHDMETLHRELKLPSVDEVAVVTRGLFGREARHRVGFAREETDAAFNALNQLPGGTC